MTHTDKISDVWCIPEQDIIHIQYYEYIHMAQSLENGAQIFGLCAIGAHPQNPRIIPDVV